MNSAQSGLLFIISSALWLLLCSAAPLPEFSGDPGFQQFIRKNQEFVTKIRNEVSEMKELVRDEFKLGSDAELLLVQGLLGIEQVDHSHCWKQTCDMEGCFNQIRAGLHTYYGYLSHISHILPNQANRVASLQLDSSNLSTNIQQQMQESGLSAVTYPQPESQPTFVQTQREIGSYLVLRNFLKFMDITYRALRHCSA
ncbi:granulocyte colony-stimulating factor [Pogona vitticeps]|uniref:Granulocyte colony-stimulating factor n=1 Tax=Pogona vitticeps TaxID=103695 RepID=A0A6J0UNC0_9SAUR